MHPDKVPGTRVMSERRRRITYTAVELPRGGEVRIRTTDPKALAAIRQFMEFQRTAHHGHRVGETS